MINFFGNTKNKDKAIFLHVPKTGGTYLSHKINGQFVLSDIKYLNHSYVILNKGEINPLYQFTNPKLAKSTVILQNEITLPLFTVVRNIFDFMVSYAGHAAGWNPKYRNEGHYDFIPASKGFEYLLNVIANREDKWPNRKFIFFQLFNSAGDLVADRINRNESLDEDVADMANGWGLTYKKLQKERIGIRKDYMSYYDDNLIDLVYKTWSRELQLFGYNFENLDSDIQSAILPKSISIVQKNEIKYIHKTDQLIINGEIRK